MTAERWHGIHENGAARDLSGGVRLRLSGPDAVRYLNGQVTNDVRKIPHGGSLPACVTNHRGRLEALVMLSRDTDGALFIASGEEDLRDFLPLRLEKYLIADNCVLEDLTESTALVHVLTADAGRVAADLVPGERRADCRRFGVPGTDIWTTPDRVDFWLGKYTPLASEEARTLEVIHGVPAWGHELSPDILPPEAGLDRTAIDFHKGCYIGQEVISRIRSVGRVNRHLEAITQVSGAEPVQAGWNLFQPTEPGNEETAGRPSAAAGTVTSAADHPVTGARHLLGFVRRTAAASGTRLLAGPGTVLEAASATAPAAVEIMKDS
ncbi:MAG: putative aminomethyltransferase [Verrucomicrobiales bacterium]|nr:putative aminomethyltransferase [Verrucomicrobiales bacterium]